MSAAAKTIEMHHQLEVTDRALHLAHLEYDYDERQREAEKAVADAHKSIGETVAGIRELIARGPQNKCTRCGGAAFGNECDPCEEKRQAAKALSERVRWSPRQFHWAASLDAPELSSRVKDPAAIAAARAAVAAKPRSIVLFGAAGLGKTSLAIATANALSPVGHRRPVFVDALALSTARQRSRLGHEAEEVDEAMSAHLLVLDEIGRGRPSQWDATPDVLLSRYNEARPTIYTTPMKDIDALRERLDDDGLARRVLEHATKIFLAVPKRTR